MVAIRFFCRTFTTLFTAVATTSHLDIIVSTSRLIALSAGTNGNTQQLRFTYTDAICRAGAVPLIVPVTQDASSLRRILQHADMLMLSGGGDIAPERYGQARHAACGQPDEQRDAYEWLLLELAMELRLPVFGICRGMQLLNVFLGGTLFQDLTEQCERTHPINHTQSEARDVCTHSVMLQVGSVIAQLYGRTQLMVNSFHHQAIQTVAHGLRVSGTSADGVVEAIEHATLPIAGVQWHPEDLDFDFVNPALRLLTSH